MDAADPDLEHPHPIGEPFSSEGLRDSRADAVIGAQHIAETGHDGVHGASVGVAVRPEREALVQRLALYPVERYPVQHATTQFHLGSSLLHDGECGRAIQALRVAHSVFQGAGMQLEQAKTGVMLGAALRAQGYGQEAGVVLLAAVTALATMDQPAEQAAAAYNLGLVLQDGGQEPQARAAWAAARELFLAAGYPAQASAAARDHGASLLAAGEVTAAVPLLLQATELASQAGDDPATGAAANALGLAHLAAQDLPAAAAALRRALACFPRGVRAADHAMVRANLALVHEQAGEFSQARLAAGQSLAVPSAAVPVREQAQALLGRLGEGAPEDLMGVLDVEESEQWAAVLREELVRALELSAPQRRDVLSGFLDGLLTRPGTAYALAESLLQVVLELPPRPYDLVVSDVVAACAGRSGPDTDRLRRVLGSAMARFAMPQWQRLAANLNAAAEAAGQPAGWS